MANSSIKLAREYCTNPPSFVKNAVGLAPKNNDIVAHSHYLEPVDHGEGSGNSRIWADANEKVKLDSINSIIDQSINNNYSLDETSFALSVAFIESGFNPDAAAASSSASGLGQFIDKTGGSLGLNSKNRFSIKENSRALVTHLKDLLLNNIRETGNASNEKLYVQTYANYHDGFSISDETKKYSTSKIPPLIEKFKRYLLSKDCI